MALPQQNLRPLVVLVVDDDVDTATSLAELLALHGYGTEVAFDGQQALDQIARVAPEVVLLDIWMPVLDGREVARIIRERAGAGTRPFLVAVTGYETPDRAPNPDCALFDLYLVKPVEPGVVVGVLERIRRGFAPHESEGAGDQPDPGQPRIDAQPLARADDSLCQLQAALVAP
jgi:CheY-like chemotaxis protein